MTRRDLQFNEKTRSLNIINKIKYKVGLHYLKALSSGPAGYGTGSLPVNRLTLYQPLNCSRDS